MHLLHDEKGKLSMARVLVLTWTLQSLPVVWAVLLLHPVTSAVVLAFEASIETGLIAWAGGPRIAQYIGPEISKVGTAVASAFRKGRDADEALEPTSK